MVVVSRNEARTKLVQKHADKIGELGDLKNNQKYAAFSSSFNFKTTDPVWFDDAERVFLEDFNKLTLQ